MFVWCLAQKDYKFLVAIVRKIDRVEIVQQNLYGTE